MLHSKFMVHALKRVVNFRGTSVLFFYVENNAIVCEE